jgi:hypothetical protein
MEAEPSTKPAVMLPRYKCAFSFCRKKESTVVLKEFLNSGMQSSHFGNEVKALISKTTGSISRIECRPDLSTK